MLSRDPSTSRQRRSGRDDSSSGCPAFDRKHSTRARWDSTRRCTAKNDFDDLNTFLFEVKHMGMSQGGNGMNFLKGGLTGLGQGLANYNNPHPVYDFSGLARGFQANRAAKAAPQNPKQQDPSGSKDTFDRSNYPDEIFPW